MNFSIIGAGKVGTSIGYRLISKGYHLDGYCTKTKNSLERAAYYLGSHGTLDPAEAARKASLIIIATPDNVIEEVANNLCASLDLKDRYVFHVSGSTSFSVLDSALAQGAFTGCMHPLQAIANVETAIGEMEGVYFGLSGTPIAVAKGEKIIHDLGGITLKIDNDKKVLYHAAACIASNYVVTLLDIAQQTASKAGIPFDNSLKPLLKLMEATLSNIRKYGSENALTGPISRGATDIIENHLEFLNNNLPDVLELYKVLGEKTVKLSLKGGKINRKQAAQSLRILEKS